MKDVVYNILEAFKEITPDVEVTDGVNTPTYWHVDKVPYLIYANKKSVSIFSESKKLSIKEKDTKEDIVKKLYHTFIY